MDKCETSSGSEKGCGCQGEQTPRCPTESGDCCPMEAFAALSCCAFKEAMKEVYVDILKSKIQKAWGGQLEKAADIILQAKGEAWGAALAKAKAKSEVKEKLWDLFSKD